MSERPQDTGNRSRADSKEGSCILLTLILLFVASSAYGEEKAVLTVDFARIKGVFRPLHGINKGPLAAGGLVDVSESLKSLSVPSIRLHDCHWPNPDVVDMHVVFPDIQADPAKAENYDFALTDEYLAAVHTTGAQIVYRLGESIEHTKVRRFAHPPKDRAKWAEIACGIIRHYNEGWANGFHYNIRYWEIWNEPENRPAMWSGTDQDYFQLYSQTARVIKQRFPDLKVGGPAVGYSGAWEQGKFSPSPFVTDFLSFCRQEQAPLDFFSWHCYTDDIQELIGRVRAIRRLLDSQGYAKTESHLNEWNYLPDNKWDGISRSASATARQKFVDRMGGIEGAVFVTTALLHLQDLPVEMCNLFHGETGAFGLFNEQGVPQKVFYALKSVQSLTAKQRIDLTPREGDSPMLMEAGLESDRQSAVVLIVQPAKTTEEFHLKMKNLPWKGRSSYEIRLLNAAQDLSLISLQTGLNPQESLSLRFQGPGLMLIRLSPARP